MTGTAMVTTTGPVVMTVLVWYAVCTYLADVPKDCLIREETGHGELVNGADMKSCCNFPRSSCAVAGLTSAPVVTARVVSSSIPLPFMSVDYNLGVALVGIEVYTVSSAVMTPPVATGSVPLTCIPVWRRGKVSL